MRFLFGLLLVLFMIPAGGLFAPCCAEVTSEACCPLDRDCTAEEGTCPSSAATAAVPVSLGAAPPACLPVVWNALLPEPADPAPPARAWQATRRLPLRN